MTHLTFSTKLSLSSTTFILISCVEPERIVAKQPVNNTIVDNIKQMFSNLEDIQYWYILNITTSQIKFYYPVGLT
ncbi:hypothetical protein [Wolbachia endosymbiont of Rhagoletis cerasi]|uniref:hypothetical protein n=1 Tax=Wolbachia endosymbiont of Rhagoletis cerasi TaxID=225363 RepID=UPI001BD348BD|nr:hypothetical protein [Wolbachia endosymbiont of Rhagoletis cerasi]MBS9531802.1 hypothetical protein [Wolbachia endosymbiont of Rhagoletis cerasi]